MSNVNVVFDDSFLRPDYSAIVNVDKKDVEEGEVDETDTSVDVDAAATDNDSVNYDSTAASVTASTSETTSAEMDAIETPVFEVKFRSKDDFDNLHGRLLEALPSIFRDENLILKTPAMCMSHNSEHTISAFRGTERTPTSTPLPDSDLFLIDTVPTPKLNAAQVPSYKRCSTEVLDESTPLRKKLRAENIDKCVRPKTQNACFNCGGTDHSLRECTRQRNLKRIQRARKKNSKRLERYHVDVEQRFAHIKPGKISSKARHALGYSRAELPFMFYRMRVMGYPPAWLEEAKVQSSGLTLFNADGTEVLKSDDEDGEADTFKYDINKILDFPGFNVDPGTKIFDDYKHQNVPQFQPHLLKECFIQSLGESVTKGYKRKKLKNLPTAHDASSGATETSIKLGVDDMEVEDAEDASIAAPLPAGKPVTESKPAPPQSPLPAAVTAHAAGRGASPTLEDLQAQQAQLLQQLKSNNTLDTSDLAPDMSLSQSTLELSVAEPIGSTAASPITTPFKASFEGTPVLKFSIYDKLPKDDNFKVGVSDVINFENLPDSTGKYEQMKDVLKNVRATMMRLQNDDE